jgi:hypothetical protein
MSGSHKTVRGLQKRPSEGSVWFMGYNAIVARVSCWRRRQDRAEATTNSVGQLSQFRSCRRPSGYPLGRGLKEVRPLRVPLGQLR